MDQRMMLEIKGVEDRKAVAAILVANDYCCWQQRVKKGGSTMIVLVVEKTGKDGTAGQHRGGEQNERD